MAPPVYVGPASEATRDLAARLRLLLLRIGDELVHGASARHVTAWLEEARRLDHQTADVDAALARAEERLRGDLRVWWGGRMDPSRSCSFGRSGR